MSRAMANKIQKQIFKYFIVLDFEATCMKDRKIEPQEIIEFPMLKIDTKSLQITSEFHRYVKPVHHYILTPFCSELTGITQDIVDREDTFPKVFKSAKEWIEKETRENSYAIVTFGDWDLNLMLPEQCHLIGEGVPAYFKRWINIKKVFAERTGIFPRNLKELLSRLSLRHIGHHHSGYDDCVNIANITRELCRRGFVLNYTTTKI
ncbi:ERI1 exoribonuclease 3-like [Artemia franciscana]|uniref:Exonuclease domain-containing protein n=2 Tax=Artemia franciscana TaxID=6661 RepID=A0AA88IB04_ARTSF|nr:hypothetical protein QYM36_001459 [Artemia franciscana]